MREIGLNKLDVINVFRRTLTDRVEQDTLINSIVMAVAEVIEENNKRIFKDILVTLKEGE